MFLRKKKSTLPQKKADKGITWKQNSWKRKATIFYADKEIGFIQMKGMFTRNGEGKLLDRPFLIKSRSIWGTKFDLIDKINEETIASIKINSWSGRAYLEVDDEKFLYKRNMWGNGAWWWKKEGEQDSREADEKLVNASISNFFSTKGNFKLGNTGEANLNALILGGLFLKIYYDEMAAAVAGA